MNLEILIFINDNYNIMSQFIVDKNGKKTHIVLPLKEYEELLEDLHDLSVVEEREKLNNETISHEEAISDILSDD